MAAVYSPTGPPQASYYDGWGGTTRTDWEPAPEVGSGWWKPHGSTQSSGDRTFNSVADFQAYESSKPRTPDPNSPHFNPSLAAQYVSEHPNAGTPPLEGQTEGDYNPDIVALAATYNPSANDHGASQFGAGAGPPALGGGRGAGLGRPGGPVDTGA